LNEITRGGGSWASVASSWGAFAQLRGGDQVYGREKYPNKGKKGTQTAKGDTLGAKKNPGTETKKENKKKPEGRRLTSKPERRQNKK